MSTFLHLEPMGKLSIGIKPQNNMQMLTSHISSRNTILGGVDLLDAHIARCKPTIQSRRWCIIPFWHLITVGMINSWLLYKCDCVILGITGESTFTLCRFQSLVVLGLIEVATTEPLGRPSLMDKS